MSEPDVIARLRPLTNDWLRSDNYGDHFTVRGILEAYDSATQRAEAAEAERDAALKEEAFAHRVSEKTFSEMMALRVERDALRKACALFVEWLDREDAGSGITIEERGTLEGEAKFHKWYNANIDLCRASVDAAKAALAVQPTTEGL